MTKSGVVGIRLVLTIFFIALACLAIQPTRTLAANETITLSPTSGVVGSTFTISGSGFTTSSVTVYFGGVLLGSASVVGGSLSNATFQVPNVPTNQPYTVIVNTPTGYSHGATFTVLASGTALANLSLSKYIQTGSGYSSCPNGAGCTIQNTAGATETYLIQYQNTANAQIAQLTITDTLQPGQSFVSASSGCVASAPAPVTGLVTVTCTVVNVPASPLVGSTSSVAITTAPTNGSAGVVTNSACATESGFVGQACSNTTYLTITASTFSNGTQICGSVTAYTAPSLFTNSYGLITIAGQTFTIAPNAQITGGITTVAPANNVCITFSFVNQAATVLTVTPNLASANVVCGVLTAISPTMSTITVGGYTYSAVSSVLVANAYAYGQNYCFLLQNNTIVGVLTGVPTAAHQSSVGSYRGHQMIAE